MPEVSSSVDAAGVEENALPAFPAEEFSARRERVLDAIGPEAAAVLQGAPEARGYSKFRQSNEFHYLSGIEVPHAYLLLDGRSRRTTLYLPHRYPGHDAEGQLSAEDEDDARRTSGADTVAGPERLAADLARLLLRGPAPALYTPMSPAEGAAGTRDTLLEGEARSASDPWDRSASREGRFVQLLRERFPQYELRDLSPILDRLRLIKSPAEVVVLRRAARLCGLGVMEALRCTRPGLFEYQLEAVAHFVFRSHGAQGEGYRAIVPSGRNTWHAHYSANDRPLRSGDLVLMDYAPDYRYYTSDIGRMWPVSGTYAPWQRELYGFVVELHKRLLSRIRPGVRPEVVLEEAAGEMREVIEHTRFSKPIYEQAARRTLGFRGHLSHPVGMAVHDVGDYWSGELAPGLVISVDPQMWVPEERLYIRVEDTIVVTEGGVENLTGFVPHDPDEVERMVRENSPLERCLARAVWP